MTAIQLDIVKAKFAPTTPSKVTLTVMSRLLSR
jgi:hypothetical protein